VEQAAATAALESADLIEQYGVLAWKEDEAGKPLILLITSRETRRWVVPRGNKMRGLTPQQCAAQEAWEEAGVRGEVGERAIGLYGYGKTKKNGDFLPAEVMLYPLRVAEEAEDWPERAERERRWFAPAEAARAVAEPGLARIISRFDPAREAARRVRDPAAPVRQRGSIMLKLFQKVMPKEEKFFDLFERHAATLVGGADSLVRLIEGSDIAGSCREIHDFENAADDVTRDVLVAVRRSFITPFDRSAITALISSMDDAVDEMWQTAKAITLYEVTAFEPQLLEMSRLGAEAARLVAEALPLMRNIGRNGARLHQLTEDIVHLEGRADDLHQQGLKYLFQTYGRTSPMDFIVRREIFSHVERVLDRLEDVADEVQGIVIDHA
jgi:predicted phosphate transport protein (TIGR00153 family)